MNSLTVIDFDRLALVFLVAAELARIARVVKAQIVERRRVAAAALAASDLQRAELIDLASIAKRRITHRSAPVHDPWGGAS